MFEPQELHDATLEAIRVSWTDGTCVLDTLLPGSAKAHLVFSGVSHVSIPRAHPWGPSKSVNAVRQAGETLFEVELQSGDVIAVEAQAWTLEREHPPHAL